MSAPAMPSPARLVGASLTMLGRKGYDRATARQMIKDVVEAMAAEKHVWEPWALAWLRRVWTEANGSGSAPARTRDETGVPAPGSPQH